METFSLEEDEASQMFLTQESRNLVPLVPIFDDKDEEPQAAKLPENRQYPMDFSDISDEDFCDIPCSQATPKTVGGRLVY